VEWNWRDYAALVFSIALMVFLAILNTLLIAPLCSTGDCHYYRDEITDWRPIMLVLLGLIDVMWFLMVYPEKKVV
jgi:hypothetical protein